MNHATGAEGERPQTNGIAVVLKGYPRLSETFIAQELKALEDRGLRLHLVSLRHPTDHTIHPIHREIHASVTYLPEYAWREPLRVLRAAWRGFRQPGAGPAMRTWLRDLRRDPTPNRVRRFAQALVLAREFPAGCEVLYAHFLHTPASVARYAAMLLQRPWAVSAHAKDIWTLADWEKREKLNDCTFAVTCTANNTRHLKALADDAERVHRVYHGIDFARFPPPQTMPTPGDGSAARPLRLLSVGRAVPKKGYPVLLRALATLPPTLHWRLVHIGGGPERDALARQAAALGLAERIQWRGAQAQEAVLAAYREADLFVLASVVTGDGDRDGLPNVLMEAQSQRLCCLASDISGIPELIDDGRTGVLVPPADADALAAALTRLKDPLLRAELAGEALVELHRTFSSDTEIGLLARLLGSM